MNLRSSAQRLLGCRIFGRPDLDQLRLRPGQVLIVCFDVRRDRGVFEYFADLKREKFFLHYLERDKLYVRQYHWEEVENITYNSGHINILMMNQDSIHYKPHKDVILFLAKFPTILVAYSEGKFKRQLTIP